MLIDKYEQDGNLFNTNFKEASKNQAGVFGYRGELVLIKGEIADAQGRTRPPQAVLRHALVLEKEGKIQFACGVLDKLELLTNFVDVYGGDFSEGFQVLFYVVDITERMQLEYKGVNYILIPLLQGVAWNELVEELCMEKKDFKGQSPADKIVTAYNEFKSYQAKSEKVDFDYARSKTSADLKWEAQGAV